MKHGLVLIAALAVSLLGACEDSDKAATGPGAIADTDLAVPADFVDEAETSITATNYTGELDALEKEIDTPAQ